MGDGRYSGRTSGEGILEDLFEAEELQDRQIDGWVETKTSLVRTKSGVELDAVAAIHLTLSLVIFPGHAEQNDTLGDRRDQQSFLILGMLFEKCRVLKS